MKHSPPPFLFFMWFLLFASCSPSIYKEVYPTLIDGHYDSEFPYKGCSKQLEEISETVKRISVMAHYKTFSFTLADSIRDNQAAAVLSGGRLPEASYQHQSVAGTGTIIFNENGKIALITCAHLVDFLDTVVTRYSGPDYRPSSFVRSISIKTGQSMFLSEIAPSTSLEVLALDRSLDLAILGQRLSLPQNSRIREFTVPLGKAKELEWGSFVYLFGYPSGYRLITKGIVSLSTKLPHGSFIVDAVISPGSSGSIALAIRDGVPNFELVGIIKMIPAQMSYVLAPPWRTDDFQYDPLEPYHGDVLVERKIEIQAGIAQAIPVEAIVAFIEENRKRLAKQGYDLSSWIAPPTTEEKKK